MKLLLFVFTVEHLLLTGPIFVLAYNISKRDRYLNEYFPPISEEKTSTRIVYSVCLVAPIFFAVLPFLQYVLFKLFHRKFHPLAFLINPINPDHPGSSGSPLEEVWNETLDLGDDDDHDGDDVDDVDGGDRETKL